ncbi:MAG: diguanylate cyclase [Magnetococcales bacterium]|nr:diguanylate cyclase [Magnetococcales bacterium]
MNPSSPLPPLYSILSAQATKRVLVALVAALLLTILLEVWLQKESIDQMAIKDAAVFEQFYRDRLQQIESEWQQQAIRLRSRIEFMRILEHPTTRWQLLQSLLTTTESDQFTAVVVTGDDGQILFRNNHDILLPTHWPIHQPNRWWAHESPDQRLFRVFSQRVWLGPDQMGYLLLFRLVDNGLLYQNSHPKATLSLLWDNRLVAYSDDDHDNLSLADLLRRRGWHDGAHHDVIFIPWHSDPSQSVPTLLVYTTTRMLFPLTDMLLHSLFTLFAMLLLLWSTLGLWFMGVTGRILSLVQIAHEFAETNQISATIEQDLAAICHPVRDEICVLAESLHNLAQSVARHDREQDAYAAQLRTSEERFRALTNSLQDTIVVFDYHGAIHYWSRSGERMFGYREQEIIGHSITQLLQAQKSTSSDHEESWRDQLQLPVDYLLYTSPMTDAEHTGTAWSLERSCRRCNGAPFAAEWMLSNWTSGPTPLYTAAIRDISERKHLEDRNFRAYVNRIALSALLEISLEPLELHRKLEVAMNIILTVPWLAIQRKGSIFLVDDTGHLDLVVQQGLHEHLLTTCKHIAFGFCLCGRAASEKNVVFSRHIDSRHEVTFPGIQPHGHYCIPLMLRDEVVGVLNLYVNHMRNHDSEEESFLVTAANMLAELVARARIEDQIKHLASHDQLTGLPNRRMFQEFLSNDLKQADRSKQSLAVAFIDLDRFKQVNDTLGHEAGDILLKTVAQRFKSCLRDSDTLARMGGDEFTLILPNIGHATHAWLVADKIRHSLDEPIVIFDTPCSVGASIGLSVYPEHGQDIDTLLQRADQAMYQVKSGGRNGVKVYEPPSVSTA